MSNRWGLLAAALVAATLSGCPSTPKKTDGAPPTGPDAGGQTTPGGDATTPPPAGGDAAANPGGTTPGGDAMAGGATTPPPAGGDMGTTTPATGGAPPAAAPGGPLALSAGWTPDKKISVKVGADEVAQLDPANPAASDAVINFLKTKHDAMVAAGQAPKVTISVPTDMKFDDVGKPLMTAAFKAGFRASEVAYQPAGK